METNVPTLFCKCVGAGAKADLGLEVLPCTYQVLAMQLWVFSRCSALLPQTKNMAVRLIVHLSLVPHPHSKEAVKDGGPSVGFSLNVRFLAGYNFSSFSVNLQLISLFQ